jgi:hypothetical protein
MPIRRNSLQLISNIRASSRPVLAASDIRADPQSSARRIGERPFPSGRRVLPCSSPDAESERAASLQSIKR